MKEKDNIIEIKNVKKYFTQKNSPPLKAVDDVSFALKKGRTLGIVGESGCGKSTLARCIMGLFDDVEGEIIYKDKNILTLTKEELKSYRKDVQMIFQDPYSSLNPRKRTGEIIAAGIKNLGLEKEREKIREKVLQTMELCGLSPEYYHRYPHEFSGGQRQRIGIARALAVNPKILVADEPTSALDVSIQGQIINLLMDLKENLDLSILFISHDLSVVKHISDEVAVMYLGEIAEKAPTKELFENPLHPYTKALLSSIPVEDPRERKEVISLKGELPSPTNPPKGCKFHTRCPVAREMCKNENPKLEEKSKNHYGACHFIT